MTSSGIGRHNSKPILEWDEVELDDALGDDPQQQAAGLQAGPTPAPAEPRSGTQVGPKEKGASPWSAVRKLFKR
ncbi:MULTISPECIES: hypothetical protein [Deinococcus]|uniref:Uncharacterized protein n=1 Tax=Deinococcus rufus TaxID=2136097 RepID=A0ABV7Z3Q3_9DEIO|nr:hypothetical protein [Deinococcus sp. AB2017081]WQE95569.1 hypothetical protein U2P90_01435 [Deinococcus sp. AB2017081]